jgi:nitrous oxidase accessory protein NosD
MIINSLKPLGLVILLLVTSAVYAAKPPPQPPPPPDGCTAAIDNLPYEITEEGVYCFTGNLSTDTISGSAITINVDNVVIDLKGWMLDGLDAGTLTKTEGIYAKDRFNISIRNGTIRGFYYGIYLHGDPTTDSQGHLIEDIHAIQNRLGGIVIVGTDSIIRRNMVLESGGSTVSANVSAFGIHTFGHGVRLLNNDIINTAASGSGNAWALYLVQSHGAVVESNRVDVVSGAGNSSGLQIQSSSDVLAIGNRITMATNGIVYTTSSTGKFMDNITSGVATPFTGGTAIGVND